MTDVPERIWAWQWLLPYPSAQNGKTTWSSVAYPEEQDVAQYILDTPEAVAKSPTVIALVKAAVEAERERCAELAASLGIPGHTVANAVAGNIAAAIREVPK